MGLTKTDLFTAEQNEVASLAKVLAHPARIAIVQHLLATNACINSDLVKELGLAQATVSQHLRELKEIGLIQGTIEGVAMNYCINPTAWTAAKQKMNQLFDSHPSCDDSSSNCC